MQDCYTLVLLSKCSHYKSFVQVLLRFFDLTTKNTKFINSVKNYTRKELVELLRETDFPDCTTYTCLQKACQNFIFKLSEIIDLFFANKNLRLRTKPWIYSKQLQQFVKESFNKYQQMKVISKRILKCSSKSFTQEEKCIFS